MRRLWRSVAVPVLVGAMVASCSRSVSPQTAANSAAVHPGRVVEFQVLSNADGSRSELLASDQAEAARKHGYTTVEFTVKATTRGIARGAWDAHRGSPVTPSDDQELTNAWGLESLTDAQRSAVVELVHALVRKDRSALESFGAYESGGDPYRWTRDYGQWDQVDLIMPPGDPRHWAGGVETDDSNPGYAYLIVDMWTKQEGPSDLSLELDLQPSNGSVVPAFQDLHVM